MNTGPFSRLPAAAVFDDRLSAGALRVLAALGVYADAQGMCYPAVTTLARRLGRDRRNVQRDIGTLVAMGYVERVLTIRATKGGYGRNRYVLAYPPAPDAVLGTASPDSDARSDTGAPQRCGAGNPSDAVPGTAPDAVLGTAQTIPLNYPNEERPSGRARAQDRNREGKGANPSTSEPEGQDARQEEGGIALEPPPSELEALIQRWARIEARATGYDMFEARKRLIVEVLKHGLPATAARLERNYPPGRPARSLNGAAGLH
jgi:hypothetical protein